MTCEKWLFDLPPADLKIAAIKFQKREHIWTECKAKLIERYLFYFVQITYHGTYIDAFSGPQEEENDKPGMWSAKLVLESVPRWFRNFHLFEKSDAQVERIKAMVASQPPPNKAKKEPKRNISIYPGDFNQNVGQMLAGNPIRDKEATFCLLDQRTFECDWKSVQAIAAHKKGGNKIELFYFFPEGWVNRSVAAIKEDKTERMERWWGNSSWAELIKPGVHGMPRSKIICEKFRSELGYKHVYPFPIYERTDRGGRIMYYMIHASDHDEATKLMWRAYGNPSQGRTVPVPCL